MGAYDVVEIWELIGLFTFQKFQQLNKMKNLGFFRDNGLILVKNMSGSQLGKVKKELQVLFKKFGLNLIIECNKTNANYLD